MQISLDDKPQFDFERIEVHSLNLNQSFKDQLQKESFIDSFLYSNKWGYLIIKMNQSIVLLRIEELKNSEILQNISACPSYKEFSIKIDGMCLSKDEKFVALFFEKYLEIYKINSYSLEKIYQKQLENNIVRGDFENVTNKIPQIYVLLENHSLHLISIQDTKLIDSNIQCFDNILITLDFENILKKYSTCKHEIIQQYNLSQNLIIEDQLPFFTETIIVYNDTYFFMGAFQESNDFYPDVIALQLNQISKTVIYFTDQISLADSANKSVIPRYSVFNCFNREGLIISHSQSDTSQIIYLENQDWKMANNNVQYKLDLNQQNNDSLIRGISMINNQMDDPTFYSVSGRKQAQELDIVQMPYPPQFLILSDQGKFYRYAILDYLDSVSSKLELKIDLTQREFSFITVKEETEDIKTKQEFEIFQSVNTEYQSSDPEILADEQYISKQYENIFDDQKLESNFQNLQRIKNRILASTLNSQELVNKKLHSNQESIYELSSSNIKNLVQNTQKNKTKEKILTKTLNALSQKIIPEQKAFFDENKALFNLNKQNFNNIIKILEKDLYFDEDFEEISEFSHIWDNSLSQIKKVDLSIQKELEFLNSLLNRLEVQRKKHPNYKPRKLEIQQKSNPKIDFGKFYEEISSSDEDSQILSLDFLSNYKAPIQIQKNKQKQIPFIKNYLPDKSKVIHIDKKLNTYFTNCFENQNNDIQELEKLVLQSKKTKKSYSIKFHEDISSDSCQDEEAFTNQDLILCKNELKNMKKKLEKVCHNIQRKVSSQIFNYQNIEVDYDIENIKKELKAAKLSKQLGPVQGKNQMANSIIDKNIDQKTKKDQKNLTIQPKTEQKNKTSHQDSLKKEEKLSNYHQINQKSSIFQNSQSSKGFEFKIENKELNSPNNFPFDFGKESQNIMQSAQQNSSLFNLNKKETEIRKQEVDQKGMFANIGNLFPQNSNYIFGKQTDDKASMTNLQISQDKSLFNQKTNDTKKNSSLFSTIPEKNIELDEEDKFENLQNEDLNNKNNSFGLFIPKDKDFKMSQKPNKKISQNSQDSDKKIDSKSPPKEIFEQNPDKLHPIFSKQKGTYNNPFAAKNPNLDKSLDDQKLFNDDSQQNKQNNNLFSKLSGLQQKIQTNKIDSKDYKNKKNDNKNDENSFLNVMSNQDSIQIKDSIPLGDDQQIQQQSIFSDNKESVYPENKFFGNTEIKITDSHDIFHQTNQEISQIDFFQQKQPINSNVSLFSNKDQNQLKLQQKEDPYIKQNPQDIDSSTQIKEIKQIEQKVIEKNEQNQQISQVQNNIQNQNQNVIEEKKQNQQNIFGNIQGSNSLFKQKDQSDEKTLLFGQQNILGNAPQVDQQNKEITTTQNQTSIVINNQNVVSQRPITFGDTLQDEQQKKEINPPQNQNTNLNSNQNAISQSRISFGLNSMDSLQSQESRITFFGQNQNSQSPQSLFGSGTSFGQNSFSQTQNTQGQQNQVFPQTSNIFGQNLQGQNQSIFGQSQNAFSQSTAAFGQNSTFNQPQSSGFGVSSFQMQAPQQQTFQGFNSNHIIGGGQSQNLQSFSSVSNNQSSFLGSFNQSLQQQNTQIEQNQKGNKIGLNQLRK